MSLKLLRDMEKNNTNGNLVTIFHGMYLVNTRCKEERQETYREREGWGRREIEREEGLGGGYIIIMLVG